MDVEVFKGGQRAVGGWGLRGACARAKGTGYWENWGNCMGQRYSFTLITIVFFVGSKMDHVSIEIDEGAHLRGS